jgi:SAM-dependent methyltransferase
MSVFPSKTRIRQVEEAVREVYAYCPPTKVEFSGDTGRVNAEAAWRTFFTGLRVCPEDFKERRVLDVGCGSCEKAAYYHDWGGVVTALDSTPNVLDLAREILGDRPVDIVQASLFEFRRTDCYDLVIADGVLHHTADTKAALEAVIGNLRQGGLVIFSLVNVWGRFWWFGAARKICDWLGGSNFHRRARWGKRLFAQLRPAQEATAGTATYFRSENSWAYDWFANPRWNIHSPAEVSRWLDELHLEFRSSIPSIVSKEDPRNVMALAFRWLFGTGPFLIKYYWLLNGAPNMVYVAAVKRGAGHDGDR